MHVQVHLFHLPYCLHEDVVHWVSAPFSHPKQPETVSFPLYVSLLVGQQNAPLQKGNGCDAGQNPKYNELLP